MRSRQCVWDRRFSGATMSLSGHTRTFFLFFCLYVPLLLDLFGLLFPLFFFIGPFLGLTGTFSPCFFYVLSQIYGLSPAFLFKTYVPSRFCRWHMYGEVEIYFYMPQIIEAKQFVILRFATGKMVFRKSNYSFSTYFHKSFIIFISCLFFYYIPNLS